MAKKVKQPNDDNQLVKAILDLAAGDGDAKAVITADGKNAAAVELGRLGGLKGGKARAKALSAKRRSEIAKKAAEARWHKKS